MIPEWLNRWLPSEEKYRARVFAILAFIGGLFFSPLASFTMNGTLASVQERAAFPMLQSQIEWTRSAALTIPCDERVLAFAPVIATAVELDRRISHEQEAQRHWYSRWFSRRAWLTVKLIPLPCEVHE